MDEILWKMEKQSQDLQALRARIKGVWDDDAAHELNSRYLDPHASDADRMQRSFRQQEEILSKVERKVVESEEQARLANEYAQKIDEDLKFSQQEVAMAYPAYEAFCEYHAAAQHLLPQIEDHIQKANQVCNDAPYLA